MKNVNEMTDHEKTLRKIIIDLRNELVGGLECTYQDEPELFKTGELYDPIKLTRKFAIEMIYDQIMNGNEAYIDTPKATMEKKHIKFLGSDFVRELIEDRVDATYNKYGWHFPNNFNGSL